MPRQKHAPTAGSMGILRKLVDTKSPTKKSKRCWDHSHASHANTRTMRGMTAYAMKPKKTTKRNGREDYAHTENLKKDTNSADKSISRKFGEGSQSTMKEIGTGKTTNMTPPEKDTAQGIRAKPGEQMRLRENKPSTTWSRREQ